MKNLNFVTWANLKGISSIVYTQTSSIWIETDKPTDYTNMMCTCMTVFTKKLQKINLIDFFQSLVQWQLRNRPLTGQWPNWFISYLYLANDCWFSNWLFNYALYLPVQLALVLRVHRENYQKIIIRILFFDSFLFQFFELLNFSQP